MRTRARGLTAGVILLAATIGLPVAIAATIGDPLHSLSSIRTGPATDSEVLAILAAVFYLAWASFVIPVVVEFITATTAWIARRPRRDIRLPLLGPQQELARALVSAVLLLLPATAAVGLSGTTPVAAHPPVTSATLISQVRPDHHQTTSESRSGDSSAALAATTQRSYVIPDIGGMRSYWALAEHYLGDGQRWREVWQLNAGRVHADGAVMDTPRRLFAGWTVLIPPAAPSRPLAGGSSRRELAVTDGDTLSGLAASDGLADWQQLWRDNEDRLEPDGQRFVDPNLIRPGWTITLPDAPRSLPRHAASNGDPSNDAVQHRRAHRESPSNGNIGGHEANGSRGPVLTPPTATTGSSESPERADTPPAAASASPTPKGQVQHHAPAQQPIEIGLAAAAALVVLDRARRIAQRRRRRGHRPLPPPLPLRTVEPQLRREARRAQPTVAAVHLAAAFTAASPPTVRAVLARDDGAVDLLLDTETAGRPPAPFVVVPGGWRLPADATGFGYAVDEMDDPYPLLAPIGRVPDGQVLIDLSAAGPVSLIGDPPQVERYLATFVAAIAGATWSDRVTLHVPAAIGKLTGRLDQVLTEDTVTPVPPPCPAAPTTLSVEDSVEPGWCTTPVHLYCGWSAGVDLDAVLRAATDPIRHVHAVMSGPHPATVTWTLDGDQLTVPGLPDPVTVTVSADDSPSARDLLDYTATAPDVPLEDPRLPDLTSDAPSELEPGQRQLRLLGPIELSGVGWLRRGQILNLLAYLALHRRGVDRHQLAAALWPDKVVSQKTMRNRLTEARALVGGALSDGPRWRLDESITTDWQQFTALAAGSPEEQGHALDLIRGRPFTGLDDCDWLDFEGFRSEVEATIVDLALTVAERELAAGRPAAAFTAARAGLVASPYEERLHRLAIRAAESEGSTGKVRILTKEMRTTLDLEIEPDDQIESETLALYAKTPPRPPNGTDTQWN
jgi:DNA-binding SARP family transcriptional activator